MEFNLLGLKIAVGRDKDSVILEDNSQNITPINEVISKELFDNRDLRGNTPNILGDSVVEITEQVVNRSPDDIRKMLDSNDIKMGNLIDALKSDYSSSETYKENEEMSRDPVIGSAMELMADDCSQSNPTTNNKIVHIEAEDKKLEEFLNQFLENNIKMEKRVWEWVFEIVKHGDFKLRRREYKLGSSNAVYYENVVEGYKVSRVEYLGKVLGYIDEENEKPTLEKEANFIHFLNSKLPNRKKVKIKVRNKEGQLEDITCFKVGGTSLVDNARYIYRIVNLLDNMLIMSRVARSTQYNVVKVEVGNAGPTKTQEIVMDVRRRIEGSTKMSKGRGMRTDPSPIPINSNVYIPVREGKGDIVIDSVNESIDVKSIVDIDYFRNKEFATIKIPKAYLGFEEELPGSLGNTSLVKLDIRYARTVQRAQKILKEGITDLCNNYLLYRGRVDDVDKFDVVLRSVTSAEDATKVEDLMAHMSIFDTLTTLLTEFGTYLDKAKIFDYLLSLVGINTSDISSVKMDEILKAWAEGQPTPIEEPSAETEEGY
jgi:hypothetical protein